MTFFEPETVADFNQIFAGASSALVYLTATWCGPCRMIAPVFKKKSDENPNIAFIKVDVDKLSELEVCKGVTGVPTFVAYRSKVEVDRKTGASPANVDLLIAHLK